MKLLYTVEHIFSTSYYLTCSKKTTNYLADILHIFGFTYISKNILEMPVESGLTGGRKCLQRVTIPEAVIIQFVLLKMSKVLLETCSGL